MFEIETTEAFRRKYAKLILNNSLMKIRIDKAVMELSINPKQRSLKTHKVTLPRLGEVYSSRVTGDVRIIWEYASGKAILMLIDIGGHSGSKSVY